MNSPVTDNDRIAAARHEAEILKEKLKRKQDALNDGHLSDIARQQLDPLPRIVLRVRRVLKGHLAKVYALHWAKDIPQLVTASQDGKLLVWEAYTTHKVCAIPLQSSWVMTCAHSPSASLIASGGLDNIVSIHNINAKEGPTRPARILVGHSGFLSSCRFLDEHRIISGSGDASCVLWNVEVGAKMDQFIDHTGDVMCIAVSPTDPNIFASGGCDNTVKVWDIREANRKCVHTFTGHESDINAIDFFPDGQAISSGSDDSTCRLFDLRAAESELNVYSEDSILCGVSSVSFSKSGRVLFAGYDDHNCQVWDALRGERIGTLNAHDNRVSCLGVSSDGMSLCTGSWDHSLKIWGY
ncbi:hypothetical protein O0I10_005959 [Lichtheimia ornata]|uniref:Uncharacterized protein n=1 Tax=Lichtheimia ornata TaxID=688661 RepID=A0AAD7V482_9FUNG|nr:uncharacterized protein O0I10_005959 [Lichtheimia ornata]KAJ8658276.1 hypothetical protein O0I10_005959 [Lichtheimia ornata]